MFSKTFWIVIISIKTNVPVNVNTNLNQGPYCNI